ncbi:TerD family protein [Bacillus licheniformis]|nr:TerD family protein [Bacillus licheniformis]
MAISLEKGQRIDLTKESGAFEDLVGLGWDPVASGSGGFLESCLGEEPRILIVTHPC